MAKITVTRIDENEFCVTVVEGDSTTVHNVTALDEDSHRYGGDVSAERLIELSFEFLLEREQKESILAKFDLPIIEHYFPEYPRAIRKRLG
ncbi:MAG: hypothetical protein CMH81_01060 [Nitrospiraceae bacterium]|nr:hypothetical protein [Nitrospiraceae bacterium]|tara:strand:- start:223 stop:495 length:273 start_codon:yes stop_codon:yes gene_type:complete